MNTALLLADYLGDRLSPFLGGPTDETPGDSPGRAEPDPANLPYLEPFNGRFRDECLNGHLLFTAARCVGKNRAPAPGAQRLVAPSFPTAVTLDEAAMAASVTAVGNARALLLAGAAEEGGSHPQAVGTHASKEDLPKLCAN